jgi:beta-glucosidase
MASLKQAFHTKQSKVWVIVTTILTVLLITVNILSLTMFYDLFSNLLGKERRITADGIEQIYYTDFTSKAEARANGEYVNELINEEGIVMLKNNANTLPIPQNAKISVFGKNSVKLVYGGSGSAAGSGEYTKTIFESLEAAGFAYNTVLRSFYESTDSGSGRPSNPRMENDGTISLSTGETPWTMYSQEVKNSFTEYSDVALIVISRIGGEGWDLPRQMVDKNGNLVEGARQADDHYLQLDQNETILIREVAQVFTKVIIIINSSAPIETGFLDDTTHYAYHANIDAALWIGAPGDTGIMALGRILKGTVTPSGKLPDTYVRNYKQDPSWQNFGNYLQPNGQMYTNIPDKISNYAYAFVDYEEGIYVGYRYYETRGFTDGEAWYDDHVVYPFGYGLSYTTFSQQITNKGALNGSNISKEGTITVNVKVTNTGTVAGRETIQIYVTAPYATGKIEKSHVMLVGFAKTDILNPGEQVTIAVKINPYDFASYDYNDQNNNGFSGYELDGGVYAFKLNKNAHEVLDSFNMNVAASGIKYANDLETNTPVVNRFSDADDELTVTLSRADWQGTFPSPRTAAEKILSALTNAGINSVTTNNPNVYSEFPILGEDNEVHLRMLIGKSYNDPLWDQLLNRITADELINLFNKGAFQSIDILSIGKPRTTDADGPSGFVNFMSNPETGAVYGTSHYACEPIMAATFNKQLLYQLGVAVGDEALIGDERGDGAPYSGWYAPGMNIHRSPFGGRVGEYYSEDPFLTGLLGAAQIQGVMSKGVYTMVKHFAVNEQETNRSGITTWLNEQTLREIYLKPFEYAVKVGKTTGMMSSFNRIGTVWAGGDYRLLTEVLREEWGFTGTVISDFNTGGHMNSKQMAYAGGDLNLQNFGQEWNARKSNASDMTILRIAAKNVLYTVVNSNAMNTEVVGYRLPIWVELMYGGDAIIGTSLAVWGFFAIRKSIKKSKKVSVSA